MNDMGPVKRSYDIPGALASCHMAIVGDYLVDGHVPAGDIIKMLKQKTAIVGIAVPGMPIGSPGMEGGNPEAYDVVSFNADGGTEIFSSHHP